MGAAFLYLAGAEIAALHPDPAASREAVLAAFREQHAGAALSPPKQVLDLGPGHAFQSLTAASPAIGLAGTKWLGMAPASQGPGAPGIHALIALNDLASGRLLAVMDGNLVTALRTAAMSAAAASFLARPDSRVIAFVGCGLQARAHLDAFRALLPGLVGVRATSRTRSSAVAFAAHATALGFSAEVCDRPDDALAGADVVVTSVPMAAGLRPFLDTSRLVPGSFVAAVDVARSWRPEGLRALDILATDDHAQQAAAGALAPGLGPPGSFDADLADLASGARPGRRDAGQRAMFVFRGSALADLAVAAAIYRAALATGAGLQLPR